MENLTYHPLIGCETCKGVTRHHFVRLEQRSYQCMENRYSSSESERARKEASELTKFFLLIHRCEVCGTERGYGNRTTDFLSEVL